MLQIIGLFYHPKNIISMSVNTVSFNYTIQNGQFKGTQKTFTVQMSAADVEKWRVALDTTVAGTSLAGSFISFFLYMRSVRGANAVFAEIGQRLQALEPQLPDPGGALAAGEIEMDAEYNIAAMAPVVPEAEAAVVAEGALDAAAAASIAPGIGWIIAGTILLVGSVVAAGLAVYDITNGGETPLVSVVFINGVPNSNFKFTAASWSPGMNLIGGDTLATMLDNKAISTMVNAGSLQYTWQTAGSAPSGQSTIQFQFDSGASCTTDLTWRINPDTGEHDCTLTPKAGENLLTALCYKQPVQHGGKTHYVLLYVIIPSETGAARASFTIDPAAPLIFDSLWSAQSCAYLFGLYNFNPGSEYMQGRASFVVGERNYILRELALPICLDKGQNQVLIQVCADNNGTPGSVLETFNLQNIQGENQYDPIIIKSVAKPRLNAGSKYWITADMVDKTASGLWSGTAYYPGYMRFRVGGDPVS